MKKFLISATVIALTFGYASVQAISESIERGYISVNTSANTELAPDVAEISIAVKTYDTKSMQKATLQNKEISEQVISTLKSIIDTTKGDYIKTADFSATPIYSYSGNKRNFDKYQVAILGKLSLLLGKFLSLLQELEFVLKWVKVSL